MLPPIRVLLAAADQAVNRYLRMDPDSHARLTGLSGKTVHLRIIEPRFDIALQINSDGITLREYQGDTAAQTADVMIEAATPVTLLRLMRGDSYAEQDVHMQGNMHTARALQRLLREIDVDWEEQLAQLIGDIPAHQLGNFARSGLNWGQQVWRKFWLDTAEYLHYETELLPARHSVDFFLSDIDTLRSDLDRLEARIRRLQRALQ